MNGGLVAADSCTKYRTGSGEVAERQGTGRGKAAERPRKGSERPRKASGKAKHRQWKGRRNMDSGRTLSVGWSSAPTMNFLSTVRSCVSVQPDTTCVAPQRNAAKGQRKVRARAAKRQRKGSEKAAKGQRKAKERLRKVSEKALTDTKCVAQQRQARPSRQKAVSTHDKGSV